MAKAKKLPSGKWRTLVYDYTDSNKKRHYKSFTADTKKESEYLASQYMTGRSVPDSYENISVKEAITKYIEIKTNSLSPTTISGYNCHLKNHYKEIIDRDIKTLNSAILQRWVGDLSQKVSPKTVHNAYGLLMSTLNLFDVGQNFKVTLPQKVIKNDCIPTDADIKVLIDYYKKHSIDMLIAVYLSAFGTLRRSELCALTADDVNGNFITVNKAMILSDGKWIIKDTPKNLSSNRIVEYPDFVIKVLPKKGKLVNIDPNTVSKNFKRCIRRFNLPDFRFHDLRHYSASIMHAIGIPDVYIMQRGGWSSDATLKKIYRNSLSDFEQKYTDKTNKYFEKMQHGMQHKKKNNKKSLKNKGTSKAANGI